MKMHLRNVCLEPCDESFVEEFGKTIAFNYSWTQTSFKQNSLFIIFVNFMPLSQVTLRPAALLSGCFFFKFISIILKTLLAARPPNVGGGGDY